MFMEVIRMAKVCIVTNEEDPILLSQEEKDQIFEYANKLGLLQRNITFVHVSVIRINDIRRFFFEVFFNPSENDTVLARECVLSIHLEIEKEGVFGSFSLWDPCAKHKDANINAHTIAYSNGKVPYCDFVGMIKNARTIALISAEKRANWHMIPVFQNITKTLKFDVNVIPETDE